MQVFRTIDELRQWRRSAAETVGLVPTMGALHEGHLALVRHARQDNDHVGVSIFVNPRQFEQPKDFTGYPRTLERDLELLQAASVDVVFVPNPTDMYPANAGTNVSVSGLTERLEGAARPGHFDGVCLIVCKLLNLFQPDRAYFGQKDYQQILVVQRMVRDLNMPLELVPVETVRDPDGLAISSRNVFLSEAQRTSARRVPEALNLVSDQYLAGERSAKRLLELARWHLAGVPELEVEYISVAAATDLQPLDVIDRPAVILVALRCGETRLIDNILLT